MFPGHYLAIVNLVFYRLRLGNLNVIANAINLRI